MTKSLIGPCGAKVVDIADGFRGQIERRARPLGGDAVSGILAIGGAVPGTSNAATAFDWQGRDVTAEMIAYTRQTLGPAALGAIGGGGPMTIAHRLPGLGLPTIGVPKTIDNDIRHNDRSFGFDSAVSTVNEALGRVQTTGHSDGRVMIVETFGRCVGVASAVLATVAG